MNALTTASYRNLNRAALIFAVFILVVTTLPYLFAATRESDTWHFSGFLFGVEDGNSYLGKMRLGGRGEWNFSIFYTSEPSQPAPLLYLPYIAVGQLVGLFVQETDPAHTDALILAFHGLRLACDALYLWVLWRFIAHFLPPNRTRLLAYVLATLGGGLGWLLTLLGQTNWLGSLPTDYYIPEGYSFLTLFGLPHLALARAALLGGLLVLFQSLTPDPSPIDQKRVNGRGEEDTSPPSPLSKRPSVGRGGEGANAIRGFVSPLPKPLLLVGEGLGLRGLLAAVCWNVVLLCVPFYFAVIVALLGGWGLALWLWQQRFPHELAVRGGVSLLLALPLFLYYILLFRDPAYALWSAQNVLASPHPLHYVAGYTLFIVPAIWGVKRYLIPQPSLRRTSSGTWRGGDKPKAGLFGGEVLLLLLWPPIALFLVYLPINTQRRLAEGVIVPLAILAAVGLTLWAQGRIRRWLVYGWVAAMCLTSAFFLFGSTLTAMQPRQPLYVERAYVQAYDWLNARAPVNAVVLAAFRTSNALPAYTHLRSYMGHGPETLEWTRKTAQVEQFFSGQMSAEEREALYEGNCLNAIPSLCSDPIFYIIYGEYERTHSDTFDLMTLQEDGWTLIYEAEDVQIWENALAQR